MSVAVISSLCSTCPQHLCLCRYNVGMREFFEARHCGDVHVLDVFNMTHALVTELPVEETLPLTYDSVHWAEVCNRPWSGTLTNAQMYVRIVQPCFPNLYKHKIFSGRQEGKAG